MPKEDRRATFWLAASLVALGAAAGLLAKGTREPATTTPAEARAGGSPRSPDGPSPVVVSPSAFEPRTALPARDEEHEQDIRFGMAEGTVVREGDAPAAGVELLVGDTNLPMWQVFSGTESDEEGRFRIEYPMDRPWAVRVNCEFAEIDGIDGLETYDPNRNIFRIPDPSQPLRIRVANMEGFGHLRCVDRGTGRVLRDAVRTEFAAHADGPFEQFREYTPRHGGWIPVLENHLPFPVRLPVAPEAAEVRISVPGYAPVTRHNRDLRGWVTVPLDPLEADVEGTIELPGEFDGARVTAELTSEVGGAPPLPREFRGLPGSAGSFHLHGVPLGTYTLVVGARQGIQYLQLERRFEKKAGCVDLGTLRLEIRARVRVRVLDAGGSPVPQCDVVLREAGAADGRSTRVVSAASWDEERWVEFADVRPGARYVVSAVGHEPAPSREFTAPSAAGDVLSLELAYGERLVPCAVRVLFEGEQSGRGWREDPAATVPLAWTIPDGVSGVSVFRGHVLPGTYRFRMRRDEYGAEPGGEPAILEGEFTVEAGKPLETTVNLLRTSGSR